MDVGDKILQGLVRSSIISAGMRKLKKWGAQNARWNPKTGYGSGRGIRGSSGGRKKGFSARPSFRAKGYAPRSSLGKFRFARSRASKKGSRKKPSKGRLLAASTAVSMDRWHERLTSLIRTQDTVTDTQQISIGAGSGGIDMRLLKNLRETVDPAALASKTLNRVLIYNYERTITLNSITNLGVQDVEIIRWRPRYDSDETAIQTFAYASSMVGEAAGVALGTFGSSLFDSRLWTTAMKAVKTYKRTLKPGRFLKLKFKRTFKKPKVIDYKGEFYYTLASYPSGAFTDSHFQLKTKLSEIITYRLIGTSINSDNSAGSVIATNAPGVWIQDESMIHYLRAASTNVLKSNYESTFSASPTTITVGNRYGIADGYTAYSQPVSFNGTLGAG